MSWPDWVDDGKRVEVVYDDGSKVVGVLRIEDFGFDGEDEYPIFEVRDIDGKMHSFAMNNTWRFL